MDRKHLISLLQKSAAVDARRTPFCPADEEIAAYVDGTSPGDERIWVDRHLPDCPACIRRIGRLQRLMRDIDSTQEFPISEARRPVARAAPSWAVAATVLLTVALLLWMPVGEEVEYRETRSLQSPLTLPEILAPSSDQLESRSGLVVRWTEVPGSMYYEVRIISDSGDLISLERVDVPKWTPDDQTALQPGQEYFIRVDAFLSDSQSVRSEHVPFRVKD